MTSPCSLACNAGTGGARGVVPPSAAAGLQWRVMLRALAPALLVIVDPRQSHRRRGRAAEGAHRARPAAVRSAPRLDQLHRATARAPRRGRRHGPAASWPPPLDRVHRSRRWRAPGGLAGRLRAGLRGRQVQRRPRTRPRLPAPPGRFTRMTLRYRYQAIARRPPRHPAQSAGRRVPRLLDVLHHQLRALKPPSGAAAPPAGRHPRAGRAGRPGDARGGRAMVVYTSPRTRRGPAAGRALPRSNATTGCPKSSAASRWRARCTQGRRVDNGPVRERAASSSVGRPLVRLRAT